MRRVGVEGSGVDPRSDLTSSLRLNLLSCCAHFMWWKGAPANGKDCMDIQKVAVGGSWENHVCSSQQRLQ